MKRASNFLSRYRVEYTPSNRTACERCKEKIERGVIRICEGTKRYHLKCFAAVEKLALTFFSDASTLPGIDTLDDQDKQMIINELKQNDDNDKIPIKKTKAPSKKTTGNQNDKQKEGQSNIVMDLNTLYTKYRNALQEFATQDLIELLEVNQQEVPVGRDECLDRLANCMTYGALKQCPLCEKGQLVLAAENTYICTLDYTNERYKCSYVAEHPERKPMIIPQEYKESAAFKEYVPEVVNNQQGRNNPKKRKPNKLPLEGLAFVIQYYNEEDLDNEVDLSDQYDAVEEEVCKLGGEVRSFGDDYIVAVLTSETVVDEFSDIQYAEENNIPLVECYDFLEEAEKCSGTRSVLELIERMDFADWESDPFKLVPKHIRTRINKERKVANNYEPFSKLIMTASDAVDPASGLQDVAHVYKDNEDNLYSVVLYYDKTAQDRCYKLQILERGDHKRYWLCHSWGTSINAPVEGRILEQSCETPEQVVKKLKNIFKWKINNDWKCKDGTFKDKMLL